jgi:hypothetical protein
MSAPRQTEEGEGNVVEGGKMVSIQSRTQLKQGRKWLFCLVLVGIVLSTFSHLWAQDASIATRMQEVVKRFVLENGVSGHSVGSWIRGTLYQVPLRKGYNCLCQV